MTDGPLADLTVIAVTDYGAGPFCAQLLAELGARVVKIETPEGDSSRRVPPYQEGTSSLFFESLNRSTESACIDLKHPDGQAALRALAGRADAVFSNLRSGATTRLGLRYAALGPVNPALVCCFLSGWGPGTARAEDPAYDYGIQAWTGHMAMTGEPGQPPARSAAPWVDFGTGTAAAFALLAAVHSAGRTGRGQDVDVSMAGFAMWMWGYLATWYLTAGSVPQRTRLSAHQSVVPSQIFPTSDGHVVVMCQTDRFWRRLCVGLELPALPDDPRFATLAARREHGPELLAVLEAAFAARSTAAWVERLGPLVPIEPIHSFETAFAAFAELAPGQVRELDHPVLGPYRTFGNPLAFAQGQPPPRRAPLLGEHTVPVLRDLGGYADEHIQELIHAGVVLDGRNPRDRT